MIVIQDIYLVTRNARDKVQQVRTQLAQDGNNFAILRFTGQYQGKQTEQPVKIIEKGKAKRSVLEQAELEFNSIVKKYKDKGYKDIKDLTSEEFDKISPADMDALVPTIKTDSSGFFKPMLAKDSNACQSSVLNKPMLCSRKLDGVRCMMLVRDGEIRSISRGGKEYDVPTTHIKQELEDFFKENPTIILDGELYNHGHHLQELSGIARLKTWEPRCNKLEYWIYDIGDATKTFEERLKVLENLQEKFENFTTVKVIEHVPTESYGEIQKLHNLWVDEGYEGLVARKPSAKYAFGKRNSSMIKVKEYMEEEFEIIDYQDGLRPEDFTFIMQTKDGKAFGAKPVGDRELKAQYMEDMDNIIGKMGTVKFFDWTVDGIPSQPIFQVIRDYE